ncbi:hypothetical protein I5907_09730 [Panacibacter sp. DH6]|uniref:Uncharacterized protein n=1 Tax=Panacibacter microcysteis TaxID=2793269 RepID=A0A931GWM0_9BACT|nr:hypothetical protein [Panacibacter microcysteis]MBG9376513.1 hypothetical protein [Panacibacter microcysteis]
MKALRYTTITISIFLSGVLLLTMLDELPTQTFDSREFYETLLYGIIGILYYVIIIIVVSRNKHSGKLAQWLAFIFCMIPVALFITALIFMSRIEC